MHWLMMYEMVSIHFQSHGVSFMKLLVSLPRIALSSLEIFQYETYTFLETETCLLFLFCLRRLSQTVDSSVFLSAHMKNKFSKKSFEVRWIGH